MNNPSPNANGPMAKTLSYAGFVVGMILMIAFIPVSKDQTTNAVVGGMAGVIGGGVGSWLGSLLDKRGE